MIVGIQLAHKISHKTVQKHEKFREEICWKTILKLEILPISIDVSIMKMMGIQDEVC